MENEGSIQTINYRLDKLEETLSRLKDVIVNDRLQEKELKDINSKLTDLTAKVNEYENRLKELEMQPVVSQAARWKQIIDAAFKFAVGAGLSYIALKLGLSK
ncbi:MAG: hypothetical protein ACTTKL_07595 [Treponema sp.]